MSISLKERMIKLTSSLEKELESMPFLKKKKSEEALNTTIDTGVFRRVKSQKCKKKVI